MQLKKFALLLFLASPSWATYTYSRTITIDHSRVSTGMLTLTNFPVLVSMNDVSVSTSGHLANANGYDLVFSTKSDCSYLLSWDTETVMNVGVSTMNVWVNVPSVSSTTDSVFYMCYGNAGITSYQGNSAATWDANYKGVWHLPNGTTLTATDSTSNGNNGTLHNTPTATAGQVDGAASFTSASSQYIDFGSNSGLDQTAITASAWINAASFPDQYNAVVSKINFVPNQYYQLFVKSTGKLAMYVFGNADINYDGTGSNTLSSGAWYYVTLTYSSSAGLTGYVNGAVDGTAAANGALATGQTSTLTIGQDLNTIGRFWNGVIDEVRISSIVRSADWIKTEYNNQSAPSTFLHISVESPASVTCPSGYQYYRTVSVNSNSVSAPLSNFPVLISSTVSSWATSGNGGRLQNANGYDLILTTATDGSNYNLAFETETYTAASGAINYWVKVPTLPSTGTLLMAYYDNSGVSTFQGNSAGTWDSNYVGVWHLGNGTTLNLTDSTSNGNGGSVVNAPTAVTGLIDGGMGASGAVRYITVPITNTGYSNGSVEWWEYNLGSYNDGQPYFLMGHTSSDNPGFYCIKYSDGNFYCGWISPGNDDRLAISLSASNYPTNTWTLYALTWTSGGTTTMYANGSPIGTHGSTVVGNVGIPLALGSINNAPSNGVNGNMDEWRVSNTLRSADWIATEYNNQNNPNATITFGPEMSCGGGGAYVPQNRGLFIQGGKTKIMGGRTWVQ
jgi:hypothetical protein